MYLNPKKLKINLPNGKQLNNDGSVAKKRSKYGAVKRNGYDSVKESDRANELFLKEKAGLISNLKEQVPIELEPEFEYLGKKYKAIVYVADFTYYDNVKKISIIEDVKGFKTQVYMLKKKLLFKKIKDNPNLKFIEKY